MTMEDVTTVICARNAVTTIERAVRSALAQGGPVVLVDDWSDDGTAARAQRIGGAGLLIVKPSEHRNLGYARLTGIATVNTPWLMWLDADDELLAGRGQLLVAFAESAGCDAVWDAAELYDGQSGQFLRRLPMPAFMLRSGAGVRLFERNCLPGSAWPLVRTEFAVNVSYDGSLAACEDLDFMLRAVRVGGRLGFLSNCGYRQYAFPSSLSRNLEHQRSFLARVLKKHDYPNVRGLYLSAGYAPRVAAWGLVSMALFRNEPEIAVQFLDDASLEAADPDEILERDGPWPFGEGWRRAFQRGTCLLLIGGRDTEAAEELRRAEALDPTAEGANNLGVALVRGGEDAAARACFAQAEKRFPGYLDARLNREAAQPDRITTHPLRRQASRSEY